MKTIIFADFHLRPYDERFPVITKFFEEIVFQYDRIIIAGDFFEFWYGFDNFIIAGYFEILEILKKLTLNKKKVIFIEGNHDFNMGKFFTEFLKIEVFDEKYFFEQNNKKFIVYHGDTLNLKEDKFYKNLRFFLRSRLANFLMQKVFHPNFILKIADKFSSTSKQYLSKNFKDKLVQIFNSFHINESFDYLICGHFHHNFSYKNFFIINGIEKNNINYVTIEQTEIIYKKWNFYK